MEFFLGFMIVSLVGTLASFANGIGPGFTFLLVLFGALVVMSWVLSFMARRQRSFLVGVPPEHAQAVVQQCFSGMGWKQVEGRGQVNFQARGLGLGAYGATRPVMSIDIQGRADGYTQVDVWTSAWHTQMGIVALCDRVVSKRFWLGRKLAGLTSNVPGAELSAAVGPLAQTAPPPPPTGMTRTGPDVSEQKAVLADPRLPERHPRQMAHGLLASVGVAYLFYGPASVADCFRQLTALAPVLTRVQPYGGGDFLGVFPGQPGLYLLAFEGQFGSAIAVCVTQEADSTFTVEHIAMRLREAPPPFMWGIGTVGGSVPAPFARIVDASHVMELYRLRL